MFMQSKLHTLKSTSVVLIAALFVYLPFIWLPFICLPINAFSKTLSVYVVNYPLQYFAEKIGGDAVEVHFPVPSDMDPAYWNPDILTIQKYQKADLILINGAGYAKWIRKTSLPQSKIVDTSKKFKDLYIVSDEIITHSHGSAGEHAHESLAFTTWLDFSLAAQQAKRIQEVLIRKRPELKDAFEANFTLLEKDLMAIDSKIKKLVSKNSTRPVIASHPVYDYFARRYQLNLKSVHWEPDEIPSVGQWVELQAMLKEHPAKWMIWEGEPSTESIEKLKFLDINSIVFKPCGNVLENGDFIKTMHENIKSLESAYK